MLSYPNFTRDGRSIIGSGADRAPGIYSYSLRGRRLQRLIDLAGVRPASPLYNPHGVGLAADDSPIDPRKPSAYRYLRPAPSRPSLG
jgi:hypothetical protein